MGTRTGRGIEPADMMERTCVDIPCVYTRDQMEGEYGEEHRRGFKLFYHGDGVDTRRNSVG